MIDLDIGEEELAMLSEAEYFIVADRLDMKREEGSSERAQQGQQTQQQAQQGRQQAQQQQTQQQESEQTQAAGQQQSASADQQQGGTVDVVSLEDWDYAALYQGGWSADNMIGGSVYGQDGKEIGQVENLLLNQKGEIVALVAEIGGFLDIGDTHVAVPWDEVKVRDYDDVVVPVTAENIEQYSGIKEEYFTKVDTGEVKTVEDDVVAGPTIWKASELLDDNVILQGGEAYGYVSDLIFQNDELRSVVVNSANRNIGYGYYAYPWAGSETGLWDPGLGYYTVPYDAAAVNDLDTFDYSALDPDLF